MFRFVSRVALNALRARPRCTSRAWLSSPFVVGYQKAWYWSRQEEEEVDATEGHVEDLHASPAAPNWKIPKSSKEANGWIPRQTALRRYCLDSDALDKLPALRKTDPQYKTDEFKARWYRHSDVYEEALAQYGSVENIEREYLRRKAKLLERLTRRHTSRWISDSHDTDSPHDFEAESRLRSWVSKIRDEFSGENAKLKGSRRVVALAIFGNTLVAVSKLGAAAITGSAAMFSEGIHSVADSANQMLLAVGLHESTKKPDHLHPYGYGSEKYVWALISGVGIFFIGCGVSVYHGVLTLLYPSTVTIHPLIHGVLAFSLFVEGWTLRVALKEVREIAAKSNMSTLQYIRLGPDSNTIAVLVEDAAAVIGLLTAGVTLGLTHYTGNPVYDASGSIVIGSLMGIVALFLVKKNRDFLLARAINPLYTRKVLAVLHANELISSVHDVKAVTIGPESFRFKAELMIDGQTLARKCMNTLEIENLYEKLQSKTEFESFLVNFGDKIVLQLGDEIDQIESSIRKAVPEIRHVDLEII